MSELSLGDIRHITDGRLHGDAGIRVRSVAALELAGPEDLSLVTHARYLKGAHRSRAACVLVHPDLSDRLPPALPRVEVGDPHDALRRVLDTLHDEPREPRGVHPTATVDSSASLREDVEVGPHAVIGARTVVEEGVVIGAHVVVGEGCRIGARTALHSNVTLYDNVHLGARCVIRSGARLGSDGFGFVHADGAHRKVRQVGGCRLGDDVEIGANSTVDRGSIGDTEIGSGTKIDNLVHIGHNVRIGKHVLIVAQVGISGSTTVGDGAVLGGQAGFGGHLSVGAGARVGAQAGVTADVAPGVAVSGYPARPHREALRAQAALFRLPGILKRLREAGRNNNRH